MEALVVGIVPGTGCTVTLLIVRVGMTCDVVRTMVSHPVAPPRPNN